MASPGCRELQVPVSLASPGPGTSAGSWSVGKRHLCIFASALTVSAFYQASRQQPEQSRSLALPPVFPPASSLTVLAANSRDSLSCSCSCCRWLFSQLVLRDNNLALTFKLLGGSGRNQVFSERLWDKQKINRTSSFPSQGLQPQMLEKISCNRTADSGRLATDLVSKVASTPCN
jgi:hypothetical protein